jgi:hypothetical protein
MKLTKGQTNAILVFAAAVVIYLAVRPAQITPSDITI